MMSSLHYVFDVISVCIVLVMRVPLTHFLKLVASVMSLQSI